MQEDQGNLRLRLFKNVSSNWVVTAATIGVTFILTPYVIHALGDDGYGTWTLIMSITGYLSLLALGVPMASVRYFAKHIAERDEEELNKAIGSCIGLYLISGVAALLLGFGLFAFYQLTYDIPQDIAVQARVSFGILLLHISIGFVALIPEGILQAHHDFVSRNLVLIAGLVLRLVLTLLLLAIEPWLVFLALIQVVCLAFDFLVCWAIIRRRYPHIRLQLADLDWSAVRKIFSFSLYVLLLGVGGRLVFQTDSLVIGGFLDVGQIPFYAVGNSFIVYLMQFIIAIAAVVLPMATALQAEDKIPQLRVVFLKWSKIALSLTILATVFLFTLGPRFIGWWIEPAYEGPAGGVLQVLIVSCVVFLPVRGVALPVLIGMGKPGLPTISFLVTGAVNLGLSIALVKPFGLFGVALGTAIPNVLFAAFVLYLACKELDVGIFEYLRYVSVRAVLGAVPVLLLMYWVALEFDTRSLFSFVLAGIAMVLFFTLIWVFFVYRDDPLLNIWGALQKALAARRP